MLSGLILKYRKPITALYILAAILSLFTVGKTTINYDFTRYLGENTLTRRGLDVMDREFGVSETVSVLLTSPAEGEAEAVAEKLNGIEGVARAMFSEETDTAEENGVVYARVTVYPSTADTVTLSRNLDECMASTGADYMLAGSAPQILGIQTKIAREMPLAMLIAVIVVAAVLFMTSHSYIEPVIFSIVLAVSILINMGTNFIFDSISFITFAVSAILQLALAMDYSIMLLNTYRENRDAGQEDFAAVRAAVEKAFMPICSSSLTTIAGLVSLMFMSFTIGFDIGIVLSKGILISMLSVFTLMPALIIAFSKPLRTTAHRALPLGGRGLAGFCSRPVSRVILPVLLISAVVAACLSQSKIEYTFADTHMNTEAKRVASIFKASNQLALLVPCDGTDEAFNTQRKMVEELSALTYEGHAAVGSVSGMVTTGEAALKYYTAKEVSELTGINELLVKGYFAASGFSGSVRGDALIKAALNLMPGNEQLTELGGLMTFAESMFLSAGYSRLIITLDAPMYGEKSYALVDEIRAVMAKYYDDGGEIVGTLMSSYDISRAFGSDLLKVNLITILAIFIIVCVSFRSVFVPALLICVIQGAVWINMALSAVGGIPVFFMCYLICLAIQMGATIDYGILLTSNYTRERARLSPGEALARAMELSLPTIYTSGLILFAAGLAIGLVCSVYYISSIGLLIASGAFFSVALVLLLLPSVLISCDRLIIRPRAHKA